MTDTSTTPLTAAELDEIEKRHSRTRWALGVCAWCVTTWPCEIRRLVAMARRGLELEKAMDAAWASTRSILVDTQEVD